MVSPTEIQENVKLIGGAAVKRYCELKQAAQEARRAHMDVDRRRKNWRETSEQTMSAWIAADAAVDQYVADLGLDPEKVWS